MSRRVRSALLAGIVTLFPCAVHAQSAPEWLASVRAASGSEQRRLLLGYRTLDLVAERDGPVLLDATSEADPGVRRAAALALGDLNWNTRDAAVALIRLLGDPACRLYAAASLMKLSDVVVDPLIEALREPEQRYGFTTLDIAGASLYGGKTARFPLLVAAIVLSQHAVSAAPLVELLGTQPGPNTFAPTQRLTLAEALSTRGDLRIYPRLALRRIGAPALDALSSGLTRTYPNRIVLLDALAELRGTTDFSRHLPSVASLLTGDDPAVATHAGAFLLRSGINGRQSLERAAATGNAIARAALAPAALEQLRVEELRALSRPLDEQDLVMLAAALNDRRDKVRTAAEAKARVSPQLRAPLLPSARRIVLDNVRQALRSEKGNGEAALSVAYALGEEARPLLPDLEQWIRRHMSNLPLAAIDVLAALEPQRAAATLLERIALAPRSRRLVASAEVLAQWGELSPAVRSALAAAAGTADDDGRLAMRLLVATDAPEMTFIRHIALSERHAARVGAIQELAASRKASDLRIVADALGSTDEDVCRAALSGLARLLTAAARPVSELLNDANIDSTVLAARVGELASDPLSDTASIIRILLAIGARPTEIARIGIDQLRDGDDWRPEMVPVLTDPRVAPFVESGLLALLREDSVDAVVFNALANFPSLVSTSVNEIVAAVRRTDVTAQLAAVSILARAAPTHPAAMDYLLDASLPTADSRLQPDAARALMRAGRDEGRMRLYRFALERERTRAPNEYDDSLALVAESAWPINDLDPLFELRAVEDYISEFVDAAAAEQAFEGESLFSLGLLDLYQSGEDLEWGLPRFTWPPPDYSDRDLITELFAQPQGRSPTLGGVDDQLVAALRATGYGIGGLYKIEGGFLRASRLEQLSSDRTQAPEGYRFVDTKIRPQGLLDYLAQLFLARPGVFRVILFAVTSASALANPEVRLSEDEARVLYARGDPGELPVDVRRLPLGNRQCYVLVYEFEKAHGLARQVVPSPLTAREHLLRAGLLRELGGR